MRHYNASNEQREGRALRQGNQNAEVSIVRYVTEGSFDIFMWQTVERKAAFIHQVMRGNVAGREVDDVGEQALSYAEVKALASGNPLLLEKAGIDNEVARLGRLRRAHHQDQSRLARVLEAAEARAVRLRGVVVECEEAIARRVSTRGDRFRITLDCDIYTARPEAGRRLRAALVEAATGPLRSREVGVLGGFPIDVVPERDALGTTVHVQLRGAPVRVSFGGHEIPGSDPVGLIQRIEHRLGSLEDARDGAARELARVEGEIDTARSRLGVPFAEEARLAMLLGRQAEITRALEAELETTVAVAPAQSSAARETRPGADVDAAAPPAGDAAEFSATPADVRAALEAVVAHGDGGVARSRYEAALAVLGQLPLVPGQLGEALATVLGSPGDPPASALTRISRSLGQSRSVDRQTGAVSVSATDRARVAGLQEARDASFDRVFAAIGGTSLGPEAVTDVRAWAGIHDKAVDALVSADAADLPRLGQLGSAAVVADSELSRLARGVGWR